MDLECIILNGISQTDKDKHCTISLLCEIKKKKKKTTTSEYNQKETDSQIKKNKLVVSSGEREGQWQNR